MPNIRVTCPACKTELEVDSKFEGKEVECGNCLEVFTAKPPGKDVTILVVRIDDLDKEKPERKPRRRRRRRDEDDRDRRDDYDDGYDRPRSRGEDTSLAVASLIMGILSIFPGCCCSFFTLPLSAGAIITGAIGMQQRAGREMALAGLVCGVVSIGIIIARFFLPFGFLLLNPN